MVLSDKGILDALGQGGLKIEPRPNILQPASVDLHLHADLLRLIPGTFDPTTDRSPRTEPVYLTKWDGYVLNPGQFVLGATLESLLIPDGLVGIVTGKSSLARIGLQVEAAGYVDPGWEGNLTLELFNMGPLMITLRPRMEICQIRFERLTSGVYHRYGGKTLGSHYQNSTGPVAGRFDPVNNRSARTIIEGTVVEGSIVEGPTREDSGDEEALVGDRDRLGLEASPREDEPPKPVE